MHDTTFLRDKRLQYLFLQAPMAICILRGVEGIVEMANLKMLELWGRPASTVLQQPVFKVVPEAAGQGYEPVIAQVLSSGERIILHEFPLTLERRGGRINIYLKVTFEPLRQKDGSLSDVMVVADDITAEVNARKQLEETELRQKIAIEAADIGTFDWDILNSSFQYSDRLARMFGFAQEQQLDQESFGSRVHPDDQELRKKAHQKAFRTGTLLYEARVNWTDGSLHWLRVNGKVRYDAAGKPMRMFGTTLDVTGEKEQAELLRRQVGERTAALEEKNELLRTSEQRYHQMVSEVQEYAIILLDVDGIIQNWNKGAEHIKQYSESEAVGKSFRMFYLPHDQAEGLPEKLLKEARLNGRAIHEGWRLRKDGTRFWGSVALTALHGTEQELIGFTKVTRDLTERKKAEEKIQEYLHELEAQNKELEQFAYVASHDLQEPLRKIRTFTERVQMNILNEEKARYYLEKIEISATRMSELIRGVLHYSRLTEDATEKEPTDLNKVLVSVLSDFELLIEEKQADVEYPVLPVLKGIPLQLHQLLSNLIGNALKFTEGVPHVRLSCRLADSPVASPNAAFTNSDKYWELSITDNGIGFDPAYEHLLFAMFQRLHDRKQFAGTGIGLALCKKIMDNHGGYITATGELSKGTTFRLYFPAELVV